MYDHGQQLQDKGNINWKKGLHTVSGWYGHTNWSRNHQIINDNLSSMNFDIQSMFNADLKFSPITNAFRCMDHLFQNVFDHLVSMFQTNTLFDTSFMDQVFEVCVFLDSYFILF